MKTKIILLLTFIMGSTTISNAQISSKSLIKQDTKVIFAVNTKTKELSGFVKYDDYLKNKSLISSRITNTSFYIGAIQGKYSLNNGVLKPYFTSDLKLYLGKEFVPGDQFAPNDFYSTGQLFVPGDQFIVNNRQTPVLQNAGEKFLDLN